MKSIEYRLACIVIILAITAYIATVADKEARSTVIVSGDTPLCNGSIKENLDLYAKESYKYRLQKYGEDEAAADNFFGAFDNE